MVYNNIWCNGVLYGSYMSSAKFYDILFKLMWIEMHSLDSESEFDFNNIQDRIR